jgi:hypothetical protein
VTTYSILKAAADAARAQAIISMRQQVEPVRVNWSEVDQRIAEFKAAHELGDAVALLRPGFQLEDLVAFLRGQARTCESDGCIAFASTTLDECALCDEHAKPSTTFACDSCGENRPKGELHALQPEPICAGCVTKAEAPAPEGGVP